MTALDRPFSGVWHWEWGRDQPPRRASREALSCPGPSQTDVVLHGITSMITSGQHTADSRLPIGKDLALAPTGFTIDMHTAEHRRSLHGARRRLEPEAATRVALLKSQPPDAQRAVGGIPSPPADPRQPWVAVLRELLRMLPLARLRTQVKQKSPEYQGFQRDSLSGAGGI